jgi:hypothetical protein
MNTESKKLGVRWTIGDVSREGFEALRFSAWGAWKLFGNLADYVICVNSVPLHAARQSAGDLPAQVAWHTVTEADLPRFLRDYLDSGMAEGVAWKFAPLRLFPRRFELSFDNDCILWAIPDDMRVWLASNSVRLSLIAEDVKSCFGHYAEVCGTEPRNLGIRGLPPEFDLAAALEIILREIPAELNSELDEQGLQLAALSLGANPLAVSLDDVAVCSPFPPHLPHLGRCGAHFVGLNSRRLPWTLGGREASDITRDNWFRLKSAVARNVAPVSLLANCA